MRRSDGLTELGWFAGGLVSGLMLVAIVYDPPREVTRIAIDGAEVNFCTKWYFRDRIEIDCRLPAITSSTTEGVEK